MAPKKSSKISGKWRRMEPSPLAHFIIQKGCVPRPACHASVPTGGPEVEAPKHTYGTDHCKGCHLESILFNLNEDVSQRIRGLVDAEVKKNIETDRKIREDGIAQREKDLSSREKGLKEQYRDLENAKNFEDYIQLGKALEKIAGNLGASFAHGYLKEMMQGGPFGRW